jgi:ribA/ribD-fused uncharacterized protein
MCKAIDKYNNLIFLCEGCLSAGVVPNIRRVYSKLKSRGVTLGRLLDAYDSTTTETTDAITQTESHDTLTKQTMTTDEEPAAVPAAAIAEDDRPRPPDEITITVNEDDNDSEPVIVKGRHDPRSNFYMFNFTYNGISYRSLEHAYQSLKALMCGDTQLAWRIRRAPSPQIAKRLADQLPRIAMRRLHELMFDLLKAKVSQCYSFRDSLRKTGSRKIFHSTYKDVDLYWCTGLFHKDIEAHKGDYDGLNVFGRMLEEIRDEHLLGEGQYETRVQYLEASNFVVLLRDGEEFYPSFRDLDFYHRGSGYHRYRR